MVDYLTLPEILAVHADLITRYGGRPGVRGPGHLEAALSHLKPGHSTDPIEAAAALWESLAQYHPFIDGNERTAFAATHAFLAVNGVRLEVSARQVYDFIIELYPTNGFSVDVLLPWLRKHSVA